MEMSFGKREMDILSMLIGRRGWVTGEEMASAFGISKKTVQQEIRRISGEFGDGCRILSSQKKGYCLEYLSDELRRGIIRHLEQNENHYNMRERTSVLALYLLFQREYVTMDQLAETFYLSKTTVFSEVKTMKRWMARQGGIALEVSGTRGVRILGSELDRRFRCATFCMPGIARQLPWPGEIWDRYEEELAAIREALGRELAGEETRLAGEDFGKICRYLAVSLLRDRLGLFLEGEEESRVLERRWGYDFSQGELAGLREQFSAAAAFCPGEAGSTGLEAELETGAESETGAEPESGAEERAAAGRSLARLEEELGKRLPAGQLFSPESRSQLLCHMARMGRRLETRRYATNYYDKELILACPLETHLMEVCCRSIWGSHFPKTEQFFLTSYLAAGLEAEKTSVDVRLVSNQSPGIAAGLEAFIRRRLGCTVRRFLTEPVYAFEAGEERGEEWGLTLTTEREISILRPEILLLPAVIRGREEELAGQLLDAWREGWRQERIRRAMERYRQPDGEAAGGEAAGGLGYFLNLAGWAEGPEISANTVYGDFLFLCRFRREEPSAIRFLELKRPVEYNRKSIRRVLTASWGGGEDVFGFFLAVSALLEEHSRGDARNLPF